MRLRRHIGFTQFYYSQCGEARFAEPRDLDDPVEKYDSGRYFAMKI